MVTVIRSEQVLHKPPFTDLLVHLVCDLQLLTRLTPAPLPGDNSWPCQIAGGFVTCTNGDWDETTQLAFIYRLSQDVRLSLQKKKRTVLTHGAT